MRFMRCKCGEYRSWTTMGSPACRTCPKCGSTLGEGPEDHPEPIPHLFLASIEGGSIVTECVRCHAMGKLSQAENKDGIRAQVDALFKQFEEQTG